MIDITLTRFRLVAVAVAGLLVLAGAATAGAVVNGWRLDAAHLRALARQKQAYDALAARVNEQNLALAVLEAQTKAAKQQRATAEKFAAAAIARTKDRAAAVASSQALDCDGVMREAWGSWK